MMRAMTPATATARAERADSARSSALLGRSLSCRIAASAKFRQAPSIPEITARDSPIAWSATGGWSVPCDEKMSSFSPRSTIPMRITRMHIHCASGSFLCRMMREATLNETSCTAVFRIPTSAGCAKASASVYMPVMMRSIAEGMRSSKMN
eukprot:1547674-Prymnesium_polylepis.2